MGCADLDGRWCSVMENASRAVLSARTRLPRLAISLWRLVRISQAGFSFMGLFADMLY